MSTTDHVVPAGTSSVGKAIAILGALRVHSVLRIPELACRTGLTKGTTYRLIRTLEQTGAVRRAGMGYALDDGVGLGLSGEARAKTELREQFLPVLLDLYESTHETVHFGVLHGFDVLCVEKLAGRGAARVRSRPGGFLPAHCTAMGKALLAHASWDALEDDDLKLRAFTSTTITSRVELRLELARIRRHGMAFDRAELEPGVLCVAAVVMGPDRRPVGAISVSGPAHRFDVSRAVDRVRRAVDVASGALHRRVVNG